MRNALGEEQKHSKRVILSGIKKVFSVEVIFELDLIEWREYCMPHYICVQEIKSNIQCYKSTEYKWNKNFIRCWQIVKDLTSYGDVNLDSICQAKGKSVKIWVHENSIIE